jgi:nucleobase:cation symporter-1, NCS1 family
MATVLDRPERNNDHESTDWGIHPAVKEHRRLSGFDLGVLWGDLSIGVLVLLSGTLLVPMLGLPAALLAIVVGTVIGCVPLALVGVAGQRTGLPTMVLLRSVLGRRGSYLPSVLNIGQLIGWTGFEFWVMSLIANQMSIGLIGFSSYWFWLVAVGTLCTALALGGPILVVRKWLERFGAWILAAVGLWITVRVLTAEHLGTLWARPGTGGMPFWVAVDLVVSQPVSWLPLVADYNRFARSPRSAGAGTFWGFLAGNIWFYALGAALALSAALSDATPAGIAQAIASLAGGWIVMLTLLVGETDEAFANIYSAAVSSLNLRERISRRGAIMAAAVAGMIVAVWLGLRPGAGTGIFKSFLYLLGSVFVPLFGVFLGDLFILGRRAGANEDAPAERTEPGIRLSALAAWIFGFLVYQWCIPTGPAGWQAAMKGLLHGWMHLPFPLARSAMGASIPSFVAALGAYLLLNRAGLIRIRSRAR